MGLDDLLALYCHPGLNWVIGQGGGPEKGLSRQQEYPELDAGPSWHPGSNSMET